MNHRITLRALNWRPEIDPSPRALLADLEHRCGGRVDANGLFTMANDSNDGAPIAAIVLPAHFFGCAVAEVLGLQPIDHAALRAVAAAPRFAWEEALDLCAQAARRTRSVLVPGTHVRAFGNSTRHGAYVIAPDGSVLAQVWQTHRSRSEEWLFDERGDELPIFETPVGNIGVIVGRDAYYPETARMLALRGADVILSPQGTAAPFNPWRQLSGVWKDAQQNQIFAVEAHVQGTMWGRFFEGRSAILGPCEITPDGSGFLSEPGDAFLESAPLESTLSDSEPLIREAQVGLRERSQAQAVFSIIPHLNPALYRNQPWWQTPEGPGGNRP